MGGEPMRVSGIVEREDDDSLTWYGTEDEGGENFELRLRDIDLSAEAFTRIVDSVVWPDNDVDDKADAMSEAVRAAFAKALRRPVEVDWSRNNPIASIDMLVKPGR